MDLNNSNFEILANIGYDYGLIVTKNDNFLTTIALGQSPAGYDLPRDVFQVFLVPG